MKQLNLAVKFLLELAVIAALGYWGASLDGRVLAAGRAALVGGLAAVIVVNAVLLSVLDQWEA